MEHGKSYWPIVLRDWESQSHGEGADSKSKPTQETCAALVVEEHVPTSLREIANEVTLGAEARLAEEARLIEEPGAERLHAGICEGVVKPSAVLL